jgi:hypothetical protein
MGSKRQLLIAASVFILLGLFPHFSFGQSHSITNGIEYLRLSQSSEGYWGTAPEVPYNSFLDTCIVAETLKYLNETGPAYNSAIQWINAIEVSNDDYFFTKMSVLGQAGIDVSTIRVYLLNVKNIDGGWGVIEVFESDIKRTTLALQALKTINYADQTIISSALGYLISTQNPDGGWGFYPSPCSGCDADQSNVYMAAMVLKTLSQYKNIYYLQTPINNAVAYLLTKQNQDGGFGSSSSTVYETSLAFLALVESGSLGTTSPTLIQNAINYLTSTQLSNGSWNDDPYSTALALRALANIKPNLSIFSTDMVFSNPSPKVGDTITITAIIHNEGPVVANNIFVRFYDGDPSSGGVLFGETTIPTITAFGSSQVSINWTIPTALARRVFVKIDPMNSIDELNETDNIASKNLTSATLPDLSITSADITFNPTVPMPGEAVTITAIVRNKGETTATNVSADFYDGEHITSPDDPAYSGPLWELRNICECRSRQ